MPKSQPCLRRIFILIGCLATVACVKAPPRTAANPEERQSVEAGLSEFAKWRSEIPALSAYVKVKIEAGSHHELFDAALLAKPPNRLFLQILDDLGQERVRVVADGRRVLFYDAHENSYQLLPQDEAALKKALHLPLSVEELIDRLLMRIPSGAIESVETETLPNPWEVTHWVQRDRDRLGTAGPPLRLSLYEAQDGRGHWKYRVAYRIGTLDWNFRRPKLRLTMNFQDADIERKIEDRRFDATPPEDATPSAKFH